MTVKKALALNSVSSSPESLNPSISALCTALKDISLTFAEAKLLHKISELALLDAVGLEGLKDVVFDG